MNLPEIADAKDIIFMYKVLIKPQNISIEANENETLLSVQIRAGLSPDAPCGGQGTCGKCLVTVITEGNVKKIVKACQYKISGDITIELSSVMESSKILEYGIRRTVAVSPYVNAEYGIAFDIGTTTVVSYLIDLKSARRIAHASVLNPQRQFGADVISRCEYALENGVDKLSSAIRNAMNDLMGKICNDAEIKTADIKLISVVGNTCMHHLFLNIDPKPLTAAPYEAVVKDEIVMKASEAGLKAADDATLLVLPNIAGFVGADTVGCILATEFDKLEDLSLMIDIGTNGEMVMGNKDHLIACSTAAGPAFEGAKIDCGMRGAVGAIDHVSYANGKFSCHVIGNRKATGICGSGLMDAVAAALEAEIIDETGKISPDNENVFVLADNGQPAIRLTEAVYLSQKDIREVQLAKGAIAAGVELMADELKIKINDIKKVYIAGAFGNYMDPYSACRIGLIPAVLEEKINMIGNAAGEGSIIALINYNEFLHAQNLKDKIDFIELASSSDFQDIFIDNLMFE